MLLGRIMKEIIKQQAFELWLEVLLFPPIFALLSLFFVDSARIATQIDLIDLLKITMSLWALGFVYRLIIGQLPIALAAKYLLAREIGLSPLRSSIINLTSLLFSLFIFHVSISDFTDLIFGERVIISLTIIVSVAIVPFLVPVVQNCVRRVSAKWD